MTGVAAVLDEDGVSPGRLHRVLDELAHRGGDGRESRVAGRVGLGRQVLRTTPEAEVTDRPTAVDGVHVALDGRIDNRRELLDSVPGLDSRRSCSDSELIAALYCEFGAAFLERVVGVFGVVVWDEPAERLVCARDPTGVRQLYYWRGDGSFVAASEPGAVLTDPAVASGVNPRTTVEFLTSRANTWTETFHDGVHRLEPGTYLVASGGDVEYARYWDPGDVETRDTRDVSVLADEFRRRLDAAVSCRLRSRSRPGVMLSGGLDSTAIAATLTRRTAFDAFSIVFDDVDAVEMGAERRRIATATADDAVTSHLVSPPEQPLVSNPEWLTPYVRGGPSVNYNLASNARVFEAAADRDRRVLLLGSGGDLHAGSRHYYPDLLRAGRVGQFLRSLWSDSAPARDVVSTHVVGFAAARVLDALTSPFDASTRAFPSWLRREFVERAARTRPGMGDRRPDFDRVEAAAIYRTLTNVVDEFQRATTEQAALRAGVELRYPFLDVRLVEFALSLPPGVRLGDGRGKQVLRAAMDGRLPDAVRLQRDGFSFREYLEHDLDRGEDALKAALEDPRLVERGITTRPALRALVDDYYSGGDVNPVVLWNLFTTEQWLERLPDR